MRKVGFLFDIHGCDVAADEGESFDVIIGNDQENSIQAFTNVDPDAFWGDNGLIPLLKKNIVYYPPITLKKWRVTYWMEDTL